MTAHTNFYHWLGADSEKLIPYHEWVHIGIKSGDGMVRYWLPLEMVNAIDPAYYERLS